MLPDFYLPLAFFTSLFLARSTPTFTPGLSNVTILATGGTIANTSPSPQDASWHSTESLNVHELIQIAHLSTIANVQGIQVANVGSHDISGETLVHLAEETQKHLDTPHTQGVVVAHGTDTLEETALFLDLTVRSEKPIILVGAMRSATAISAEGPINLQNAVALASNENARNRGVMIVMNDMIGPARFTSKTNANRVDAFKATDQGSLGMFVNGLPRFFYTPSRPTGHRHFNLSHRLGAALPKVDILYGYQDLEPGLLRSAVERGARGIVLAGLGAGFWPTRAIPEVRTVMQEYGVPVIMSRRPQDGFADGAAIGLAGCGFMDPPHCRILVQLCIALGIDISQPEGITKCSLEGGS